MPTYFYGVDMKVDKAYLFIDDESYGEIVALDNRVSICSETDLQKCFYLEIPFDCHKIEVFDNHGEKLISHPLKFTKTRLKNCSPFDDKVDIEIGGDYGWILSTVFQDESDRHTCLMEFSGQKQSLLGFADLSCQ